jgi:hypothetical protein
VTASYLLLAGLLISTFLNVYALGFISMLVSAIVVVASLCMGCEYPVASAGLFCCYLQAGYLSGLFFYGVCKFAPPA